MRGLHSFDVFDTLIRRVTLDPLGIFLRVQDYMRLSGLGFPASLLEDYPSARSGAESNVRYAYRSTYGISREIRFEDIFQRLASVYALNTEQAQFLLETELECEQQACQPRRDGIEKILALLDQGERVVLISDMYLPEPFVRQLLIQAEPRLHDVPLYLSSSRSGQKTTGELFKLVADAEGVGFANWTHYGDNPVADGSAPAGLGIKTVLHSIPQFNDHERALVRDLHNYEAYCIAALLARYRFDHQPTAAQEFTYTRVSLYLVTYVLWVLNDAVSRGIENLYFISRDGHHLKRIADVVIQEQGLSIATHYLYGSRRVWWVASFIDRIDAEFFLGLENLKESCRFADVLESLVLTVSAFQQVFPDLPLRDPSALMTPADIKVIIQAAKASKAYETHILTLAALQRPVVSQYLKEAVGAGRKSAFVEYWGRGFTQACFGRLLSCVQGHSVSTAFYYARSIYQSDAENIRYNFTVSKASLLPVERLFANFPHGTVAAYEQDATGVRAVTEPRHHDAVLFAAMETLLPQFAIDLCQAGLANQVDTLRRVFDWAIARFPQEIPDDIVWRSFAHLKDSNRTFGPEEEFAPAFGFAQIARLMMGVPPSSGSVGVSLKRSPWLIRKIYPVASVVHRRMHADRT